MPPVIKPAQLIDEGWFEDAKLWSGNAPVAERSGCPTSKARSLAKQGRKRPRENPNHRSFKHRAREFPVQYREVLP